MPSPDSTRRTAPQDTTTAFKPIQSMQDVDSSFLESLVGYNARRASLAMLAAFASATEGHELKVVEFSMLSLIAGNPGITNSYLCTALSVLPPNTVGLINGLVRQGLVTKQPHPQDRRAFGLFATPAGHALASTLQKRLLEAERAHLAQLSAKEQRQLIALLQKIYLP